MTTLLVLVVVGLPLGGCATLGQFGQPTPQQRAQSLQSMLTASGFTMVPAQTQQQIDKLKALPPLKVNYYVGKNGRLHYWLADPYYCKCLYDGDDIAYQQFESAQIESEMMRRQQAAVQSYYQPSPMMGWGMGMGGMPMGGMGMGGMGMGMGGMGMGRGFFLP